MGGNTKDSAQTGILALIAAFRGSISVGIPILDKVIWELIRGMFFFTAMYFMFAWGWWVADQYWIVFQDGYAYLSDLFHSITVPGINAAVIEQSLLIDSLTDIPPGIPNSGS